MPGLYVHFPFCASKCIYCDFYARVRKDWNPYVEALLHEISDRVNSLDVPPTTLYFGGGTPSLLPSALLARVAAAISEAFGVTLPSCPAPTGHLIEEFTVEVNPDDITSEKASALRQAGATRISMGVQSFDDDFLRWMHRRHTAADAVAAFDRLRKAGFDNLSLDLIFGFTGLDEARWMQSIEQALSLQPEHISCYQMMGRWADGDEEHCRRQYALLQERLSAAGFEQYEISNYARPGFASRHNSAYWSREPYLGFGAGAHSFDGDRRRSWNTPDIDAYMASEMPDQVRHDGSDQVRHDGSDPVRHDSETLSDREIFEEKLMLALRTAEGLRLSALTPWEQALLAQKEPVLEHLSRTGKIQRDADFVRLVPEAFFVSDDIIRSLFPD